MFMGVSATYLSAFAYSISIKANMDLVNLDSGSSTSISETSISRNVLRLLN